MQGLLELDGSVDWNAYESEVTAAETDADRPANYGIVSASAGQLSLLGHMLPHTLEDTAHIQRGLE